MPSLILASHSALPSKEPPGASSGSLDGTRPNDVEKLGKVTRTFIRGRSSKPRLPGRHSQRSDSTGLLRIDKVRGQCKFFTETTSTAGQILNA